MTRSAGSGPPEPAFEQRFGRPRWVLFGPVVVVAAIAIWVAAVQLGKPAEERDGRPDAAVASPPPSARPSGSPEATPAATPTPAPFLQLFGPPLDDRVLIRDDGLRFVDLATGARGDSIGATGYLDRVVALPDGRFVCLCSRQRTVGEERTIEVTLELLDSEGGRTAELELGTWVAADLSGYYDDPGPFSMDAAHDAAGGRLAVAVSVRRPPEWHREVLLVDLTGRRVIDSATLPPAASGEPGVPAPAPPGASPAPARVRWAPAASLRFSTDGRHLVMSAIEIDVDSGPEAQRSWIAELDGGGLRAPLELEPATGVAGDPCLDAFPDFGAPGIITTVCPGDRFAGPFVRRVRVDGTVLRRISLRDALKDAAPPYQLLDRRGTMWLWDAWTRRAVRVDLVEGDVEATRAVGGSGVQARVVDPAVMLTPDGAHLVTATADVVGDGTTGTRILVIDAETLELVSEQDVGPDIVSLGMSADGGQVYVAHAPPVDADGTAHGEARMSVLDLHGGALRAVLGRLGSTGFTIVDPRSPGG